MLKKYQLDTESNLTQGDLTSDYLNTNNDTFTDNTNYINSNDFMMMSPSANTQEYSAPDSTNTTNEQQFANFDIAYFEQNKDASSFQQYEQPTDTFSSQQYEQPTDAFSSQQYDQQQTITGQSSINWSGQNLDLFSSQPPLLPNTTPSSDFVVVLKLSLNG